MQFEPFWGRMQRRIAPPGPVQGAPAALAWPVLHFPGRRISVGAHKHLMRI